MSDFQINVNTSLNTSAAEQKINAFLNEPRKLKVDVDINNQSTGNLAKNIEKGLKSTKIDTSAFSK